MNNTIKRTWNQGSMVNIEDLRGMTFQAESGGHTFVISAVDADGNAVAMSGTPAGTMLRPDNTDQALTCSISGGNVYATLPAGCYDVPGRAGITIFLTSGGQKAAIYAAVVSITRTQSGTASPGTTASVVDLINAINTAISGIPATDTALKAAMAPTYSNSALYAVGDYAWYNGTLYRCTTAITTAETWTSGHWTTAAIGTDSANELRGLKSVLDYHVEAIEDAIELPLHIIGNGYSTYNVDTPIITGINLISGHIYQFHTIAKDTPKGTNYCRLFTSSGNVITACNVNAETTENTIEYTAAQDYTDAYIALKVTSASAVGTNIQTSLTDITGKNAIERIDDTIEEIEEETDAKFEKIQDETYNLWEFEQSLAFEGSKYINPDNGYFFEIPAGTYTLSAIVASESTAHGYCGAIFRYGSTVLATANVSKSETRSYKKVELSEPCNNIILLSAGTAAASDGVNGSWTDIMLTSGDNQRPYIQHITATDYEVRRTVDTMRYNDIVGYKKPNLIQQKFVNTTIGGAQLTVDSNGVVTINGETTSNSGTNVSVTLNRGKYILSGISGGGTGTFWYRLIRADSSYKDVTDGQYEFEVTSETETVGLWIRVKSGNTINTKIYPMIRDASIYDWTYAPYGEYAILKSIQDLIDYTVFNWSGKKMNVLGDSIVAGSWGNFANVIGGILNLSTVRNYGIGGSRIASTDQDAQYPPAVTRYSDMDNDAQIIIVHSGTNDYTGQVPLGSVDSQDITTFNGALNVLMEGLRTKFPTSLIIFSNILRRYTDDNDQLTIKADEYRQALEAACRRHQIVFYNGYTELPFSPHGSYNDGDGGHYMHDGLHPNQTGANVMGRSIAGFIKWH